MVPKENIFESKMTGDVALSETLPFQDILNFPHVVDIQTIVPPNAKNSGKT